ncbi:MAG: hypothetical protein J3R72DRAFT_434434 [Linnemannia gamsii]|nr:MAG: hypothetical protein J3R72DRAFT_434434 [Linnemannia gamsii]
MTRRKADGTCTLVQPGVLHHPQLLLLLSLVLLDVRPGRSSFFSTSATTITGASATTATTRVSTRSSASTITTTTTAATTTIGVLGSRLDFTTALRSISLRLYRTHCGRGARVSRLRVQQIFLVPLSSTVSTTRESTRCRQHWPRYLWHQ